MILKKIMIHLILYSNDRLVINDNPDMSYEKYAEYSIRYADALIKKLNKQL